ncbi:MAG: MFS transporter, partial [Burkholderia gladioli]
FMGSFLEFGTLAGYLLGAGTVTALTSLLTPAQMLDWGWRIPFFVAGPLGLIGLYIRTRLEETPAFRKEAEHRERLERARPRESLVSLLAGQWRALLVCVGLVLIFNVTDYMALAYLPNYLSATLHYDETRGLVVVLAVMVLMMPMTLAAGWLSDRVGRRPVMLAGCIGLAVCAIPALLLVRTGHGGLIFAGMMLLGVLLSCFCGVMPSALPALFPTRVRYSALAIGFNVSVSLFGGTTPLVTAWLVGRTGDLMMPAYYLIGAAVIGAISVLATRESAGQPLPGSAPCVATQAEAVRLRRAAAAGTTAGAMAGGRPVRGLAGK